MNKAGFSLIEIIIAFLLASVVTLGLYQLLSQSQKAVKYITRVIDVDTPLAAFYAQLEKDVTGMFAPRSSQEYYAQKKEEKNKKIDQVFVLENQDNKFVISFITTGGIQKFDKNGTDMTQPFVRRVAYILEPGSKSNTKRLLYKYNSSDLDLDAIIQQKDSSYEILDNIKQLSIEITVFEYSKQEPGKPAKKPASSVITSWNEQEIWDKYKTLIPAYITFKGTVVDNSGKQEYNFEFKFIVPAYNEFKELPKKTQKLPAGPEKPKTAFSELADFFAKKPEQNAPTPAGNKAGK